MTDEKKNQTREQIGVLLLVGVLIMSGMLLLKDKEVPTTFTEGSTVNLAETKPVDPQPAISNEKSQLININKASIEELDKLPGVGPATAQKILDYRKLNGGFKTVQQINEVSGIGEVKYSQIKDLISI